MFTRCTSAAAAAAASYLVVTSSATAFEVAPVEDLDVLEDVLFLDDANLQGGREGRGGGVAVRCCALVATRRKGEMIAKQAQQEHE